MNDPIADMLTRIRNATRALLPSVSLPHSAVKESIAQVLKREGFVDAFNVAGDKIKTLTIKLRYVDKQSPLRGLRRASTPGLRRYVGADEIPRVLGGLGIAILTTPKGIMTGAEARKANVGGEVLCVIW